MSHNIEDSLSASIVFPHILQYDCVNSYFLMMLWKVGKFISLMNALLGYI